MDRYIYFITDDGTVPKEESAIEICQDLMKKRGETKTEYIFRYGSDVNNPYRLRDELDRLDVKTNVQFIFINKKKETIGILTPECIHDLYQALKDVTSQDIKTGDIINEVIIKGERG